MITVGDWVDVRSKRPNWFTYSKLQVRGREAQGATTSGLQYTIKPIASSSLSLKEKLNETTYCCKKFLDLVIADFLASPSLIVGMTISLRE